MTTDIDFRTADRTFIVAEIGVNHEGDKDIAMDLIRKAAECGADAVKFQTYSVEHYVSSVQPERRDRAARFQLGDADFRELSALAGECGVVFFSTPFHPSDVDFLDQIAPIFKISSGDLTYTDLIRHAAAKNKPVIMSTGLGTRDEIQAAVDAAREGRSDICEAGHLVLMHCVCAYPPPAAEANVANIRWLKQEFGLPTGYSDHTLGIKACELAVATGATVIEKHFTYRKEDQAFHDHKISADPDDLRALVDRIREVEVYLGETERRRGPSEEKAFLHMRRSVGALRDIPRNTPVKKEWLVPLRPAWGVPVERIQDVVGRKLTRDVAAGDLIKEDDLAP